MNHGRIALIIAALALSACADHKPNTDASSRGTVGTFKAEGRTFTLDLNGLPQGMTSKETLTINGDSIKIVKVCSSGFDKIPVELTVPAIVSDTHFEVKTKATKTEKLGRLDCTIEIAAGITAYEVKDGELTLSNEEGSNFYGYALGQRPTTLEKMQRGISRMGDKLSSNKSKAVADGVNIDALGVQ